MREMERRKAGEMRGEAVRDNNYSSKLKVKRIRE